MKRPLCLVVTPIYPPVPSTRFDWCAYIDGQEESGRYGYGPTREAAVAELFESIDEAG
jgi:hypothetical protein